MKKWVTRRPQSLSFDTPMIDLLWGPLPFQSRDRCLLKEKLLAALDKRVPINVMNTPPISERQTDYATENAVSILWRRSENA